MFLSFKYSPKFSANENAALLPLGNINPYKRSVTEIISLFFIFAVVPLIFAALELTYMYVSFGSHSISSIRSRHITHVITFEILAIYRVFLILLPYNYLPGFDISKIPHELALSYGSYSKSFSLLSK